MKPREKGGSQEWKEWEVGGLDPHVPPLVDWLYSEITRLWGHTISAVRARESKEIFKFGDESKKLSESDFIAQINNRNAQYFACTMVILKFKFS